MKDSSSARLGSRATIGRSVLALLTLIVAISAAWATQRSDDPPAESTKEVAAAKKEVPNKGTSNRAPKEGRPAAAGAEKKPPTQDKKGGKPDDDLPIPVGEGWVKVARDYPVWVDLKKKEVMVQGRIAVQRGQLEMFACPAKTKEHESVVAVEVPARFLHLALLAVGARPGKPVAFEPKYRPATGTKVSIEIVWKDADGKVKRVRAQDMVKNAQTGKPLKYDWVFGGSLFWTDEMTGERYYAADQGELICVSNFTTAMLDLPIESTAANRGLLYVANSKNIPERGTPVLMILRPKVKQDKKK